jgi:hypothetical protein
MIAQSMTKLQTRLRLIIATILVFGLGSAILIYLLAEAAPANPLGYEPAESKMYVHDMLLYGGRANLLGSEFVDWFDGLWHGKRLAFTVACITLVVAGALLYFGAPLPPDSDAGAAGEKKQQPTDQ